MSMDRRREAIEPEHPKLSVVRQCELVSIARSTFYRRPAPAPASPLGLALNRAKLRRRVVHPGDRHRRTHPPPPPNPARQIESHPTTAENPPRVSRLTGWYYLTAACRGGENQKARNLLGLRAILWLRGQDLNL